MSHLLPPDQKAIKGFPSQPFSWPSSSTAPNLVYLFNLIFYYLFPNLFCSGDLGLLAWIQIPKFGTVSRPMYLLFPLPSIFSSQISPCLMLLLHPDLGSNQFFRGLFWPFYRKQTPPSTSSLMTCYLIVLFRFPVRTHYCIKLHYLLIPFLPLSFICLVDHSISSSKKSI